jgi:glycosyltransferase involved in cell wall biosynthesis
MKELRIACYGFVDKNAGSGVKSHFFMLEELAKRGVQIDFFGWRGFNCAEDIAVYPNFRYIDLPSASSVDALMKKMPSKLEKLLYPMINILFNDALHFRVIEKAMLEYQPIEGYDIAIFLGLCAPFRIPNTTMISLLQGAPGSEWALIAKNKKTIVKFCGLALYAKLKTYYAIKDKGAYKGLKYSDAILCTSKWTKSQVIQAGFNPDAIYTTAYPVELDRFAVKAKPTIKPPGQEKILLSLGRLDPRKRLDLLLEAFKLVLQERQDVRLKIIGSFNYVPGYRQMIDRFPFPEKLEYHESVLQSEVPKLMHACDLLVQASEGENFGSSVAESLSCGLSVIVGMTNGTKDYLGDSSFVFEDYTPESLKSTILEALEAIDTDETTQIIKARRAAEEYFEVISVVNSLQDVFSHVVNKRQPSRFLVNR